MGVRPLASGASKTALASCSGTRSWPSWMVGSSGRGRITTPTGRRASPPEDRDDGALAGRWNSRGAGHSSVDIAEQVARTMPLAPRPAPQEAELAEQHQHDHEHGRVHVHVAFGHVGGDNAE